MKYAVVRADGITELRQDDYPTQGGAVVLTDEQFNKLCSGFFILQNGEVIDNPIPPKFKELV